MCLMSALQRTPLMPFSPKYAGNSHLGITTPSDSHQLRKSSIFSSFDVWPMNSAMLLKTFLSLAAVSASAFCSFWVLSYKLSWMFSWSSSTSCRKESAAFFVLIFTFSICGKIDFRIFEYIIYISLYICIFD